MNIGMLGTGMVGQIVGGALIGRGHDVVFGTRDVGRTMAEPGQPGPGSSPFSAWLKDNPGARLESFAGAIRHGEILINATAGTGSLSALQAGAPGDLDGKILIDIANPLDFSRGFPPSLTVCNTDSLAEQIQRTFPSLRVVKSLNTMNAYVMTNPSIMPGDHTAFVCGNDPAARDAVTLHLQEWFGWKKGNILDLGDLTAARGVEMLLPLWVRLYAMTKNPMVAFHIVQGELPPR